MFQATNVQAFTVPASCCRFMSPESRGFSKRTTPAFPHKETLTNLDLFKLIMI